MNKVLLVGYAGADPEVRITDGGSKIAVFGLATNENIKKKSGEYENHTEWHNIIAWGGRANYVEMAVTKGCLLEIEGRIRKTSYIPKGTDQKKYNYQIQIDTVNVLRKPSDAQESIKSDYEGVAYTGTPIGDIDDDLPF